MKEKERVQTLEESEFIVKLSQSKKYRLEVD